jgi:hypothetical protein
MNQCHVQLGRLTNELESVIESLRKQKGWGLHNDLRRVLYGIHALLTAHFEQAEQVFSAALEHLSPQDRELLFSDVERSAQGLTDLYE